MASYNYTFQSGDGVTPTRLNDARTVSDIVNADIKSDAAIALSKLATGALPTAITVASANIVDGTIVNADINASAAIAGTKIAPDFGSQGVQTTGTITVGAPQAVGGFGSGGTSIQAHGTSGARFLATRWSNDGNGAFLLLLKSRGAAVGTRGAVQSGDSIASMDFYGDDGTGDVPAARISAQVDGTPGTNDMPGRLVFSTTADGGSSVTERMRITSGGNVGIGTSSPNAAALLDVSSTAKGFLPPRMTTAQRDAISTPPAGLVVYNTSTNVLNFYNGSAWAAV